MADGSQHCTRYIVSRSKANDSPRRFASSAAHANVRELNHLYAQPAEPQIDGNLDQFDNERGI